MAYKKTWLSYILWAAFTCVTGIMLAEYTLLFWKMQIKSDNSICTPAFVFLTYALVVGLYFLLRKTFSLFFKKHAVNERTALIWEIFAVLFIFAMGFLYRLYLCSQSGADMIAETQFYHMAVVKDGKSVEPIVHGISYLYVQLLSIVFSFLGNKVMVAVCLQIFIEMLTMLIAYFLIRKMIGKIPACIVVLMLAVSPVYTNQILRMTPDAMFLLLYLIGMFTAGSYVKAYCTERLSRLNTVLGAVFSGILIGILTYLDVVSFTLIIILAGLITGINTATDKRKFTPFLLFLTSIIMCGLALAGILALDACVSRDGIEAVSMAWLNLYTQNLWINTIIDQHNYSVIEYIIQVILAAFLIIAFWNRRKVQNSTPWMCFMLLLAPLPFSGIGILNYQVFYVFIWSVLAGLGLQQCLIIEIKEAEPENNVKTVDAGNDLNNKTDINDAKVLKEDAASDQPKTRFIENPLPLPKKHEKKEIDYKYEVAKEKMKFDIEIAESDDFDI